MKARAYREESDNFAVNSGVKQGIVLSPNLLSYVVDWIIERVLSTHECVRVVKGVQLTDLDYADNIDLV